MTREEAIFYIKELQKTYASMDKKVAEAVDMAIEALSQPIVAKHFDIQSGYIYCSPQIAENVKVVVRCKDCEYRDGNDCWHNRDLALHDDDFCSLAKMKGGAE